MDPIFWLFYSLGLIVFLPVALVLRGVRYLRWRSAYKAQVRRLTALRAMQGLDRESWQDHAAETRRRLDHLEGLLERILKSQVRNGHS